MAHGFSATTHINRPIEQVFAFLAAGTNDPKFSPRVQEIRKTTDGPVGVGTVFESVVKDAGMKSNRHFKLTEFEEPSKIRWTEVSPNAITVPDGFEGHGFGKVILPLAARAANKDADNLAGRIKSAVEGS